MRKLYKWAWRREKLNCLFVGNVSDLYATKLCPSISKQSFHSMSMNTHLKGKLNYQKVFLPHANSFFSLVTLVSVTNEKDKAGCVLCAGRTSISFLALSEAQGVTIFVRTSVSPVQVCLELPIFIILAQISFRSLLDLS